MKLKRFLILVGILTMFIPWLVVSAFAEEFEVESPAEDTVVEDNAPQITIPEHIVNIKYTEDSSAIKGIRYETYVDPVTFAVGFKIVEDLSIGHIIYDNPDTAYIDGIRVNGETVNNLTIWLDENVTYDVAVRTVYEDNLLGDIAKIIDGTFDFKTLLENPIMLLMGAYYVISIISVIVVTFTTAVFKNKKVKSADEIAAKVDTSAQDAVEKMRTEVTDVVLNEVQPILQTILSDIKNVVTAVTLSTSKNKEAPLAMLDTLQKAANSADATGLIDSIRKTVADGIAKNDATRAANVEDLHRIANTEITETVESASQNSNTKSIF